MHAVPLRPQDPYRKLLCCRLSACRDAQGAHQHPPSGRKTLPLIARCCYYSQHHVFAGVIVRDKEQGPVGDVGVIDKALHGGVCSHVKDTTKQLQVRLQQREEEHVCREHLCS